MRLVTSKARSVQGLRGYHWPTYEPKHNFGLMHMHLSIQQLCSDKVKANLIYICCSFSQVKTRFQFLKPRARGEGVDLALLPCRDRHKHRQTILSSIQLQPACSNVSNTRTALTVRYLPFPPCCCGLTPPPPPRFTSSSRTNVRRIQSAA